MKPKSHKLNNFNKVDGTHARSPEGFDVFYEGWFNIIYADDCFRVNFEIDEGFNEEKNLFILHILKKTIKISYLKNSSNLNENEISSLAIDRITAAVQFLNSESDVEFRVEVI